VYTFLMTVFYSVMVWEDQMFANLIIVYSMF
jgi:hypothetical protein